MLTAAPPTLAPTGRRPVPSFALYGETGAHRADLLHVETLAARSHRYRWVIAPHTHRGLHQLLWIESGRSRIRLDERGTGIDGPAIVTIPAGVVHGFGFAPDIVGVVMTIGARRLLGDITGEAVGDDAGVAALFDAPAILPIAAGATARRIASLCDALVAHADAAAGSASPVPGWLARSLLWTVAQEALPETSGDAMDGAGPRRHPQLAGRFRLLVDAHHGDHWPVTRYAASLEVSVAQLNRACREGFGCSALEAVHERLAAEARRRLLQAGQPVAGIASELGFRDPSYFCRFFRRRTGESPQAWRRRHCG